MPALAATTFEDNLVVEEFGFDGSDPIQKLLFIAIVVLSEMLPLPAKARCGGSLLALNPLQDGETRNPAHNRESRATRETLQLTLHDLLAFGYGDGGER